MFTFVPNGGTQAQLSFGEIPKRALQYIVRVKASGKDIDFDRGSTPDKPGNVKSLLEEEVRSRVDSRIVWVDQILELVTKVEQWSKELGWDTRRIEKRLENSYVGKHTVQALLMQEETCRVQLEPVGRCAPGAEGLVDLYLLPAYDDIATFYYHGGS